MAELQVRVTEIQVGDGTLGVDRDRALEPFPTLGVALEPVVCEAEVVRRQRECGIASRRFGEFREGDYGTRVLLACGVCHARHSQQRCADRNFITRSSRAEATGPR